MASYSSDLATRLVEAKGHLNVSTTDFCARFVLSSTHPEAAEGIALYLPAYAVNDELDNEGIAALLYDMYASAPYDFNDSLKTLWNI